MFLIYSFSSLCLWYSQDNSITNSSETEQSVRNHLSTDAVWPAAGLLCWIYRCFHFSGCQVYTATSSVRSHVIEIRREGKKQSVSGQQGNKGREIQKGEDKARKKSSTGKRGGRCWMFCLCRQWVKGLTSQINLHQLPELPNVCLCALACVCAPVGVSLDLQVNQLWESCNLQPPAVPICGWVCVFVYVKACHIYSCCLCGRSFTVTSQCLQWSAFSFGPDTVLFCALLLQWWVTGIRVSRKLTLHTLDPYDVLWHVPE